MDKPDLIQQLKEYEHDRKHSVPDGLYRAVLP